MSRPQRVRVPWRVITSAYADATVAVYVKIAALARRREGCEAGVSYLASILPMSRSSVERALTQLGRPDPVDDVVELATTRRTLPGGRGQTAVRRPRVPGPSEPFVWVPSRAPEQLPPRQLRAYAAISHAVAVGHPLTLGELGGVLRHRSGARAGQPLSESAAARLVTALEKSGWISVDRRAGAHGRHLFTVHDAPFQQLSLDLEGPDLDDGSGGDLGGGSLATREDHRTDPPDDARAGSVIRRRRAQVVAGGPVENPPLPPAYRRPYTGPELTLAPRIWQVLAPVRPLLPGLSPYVVRELARRLGRELDAGVEPDRLRHRLQHRYASTQEIRDPGRWLLGAAVRRHGCGLTACESGVIWRTGMRCEVCAELRQPRPAAEAAAARPPLPRPASTHPYTPDRRGACATCDLPARTPATWRPDDAPPHHPVPLMPGPTPRRRLRLPGLLVPPARRRPHRPVATRRAGRLPAAPAPRPAVHRHPPRPHPDHPMNDPELPRPAPAQLRELIAATRPDWDDAAVADALARAHTAGMTWGQVLTTVGKLLADPKSTPAELADTAPRPWRATSPGDYDRGAALARAALRETHHITDDERGRAR